MLEILLDNTSNQSVNLYLRRRPYIPTPNRKLEHIEVDGRDGSLTVERGYMDLNIEIEFTLIDNNIRKKIRELKKWLLNKKQLSFSDDPNIFYKIKSLNFDNIDNQFERFGYFKVTFICEPFLYETEIVKNYSTSPVSVINNRTQTMLPKIKVFGSGDVVLKVNGVGLTIKSLPSEIVLDCELQEAYKGTTTNLNHLVYGVFPVFNIGTNKVEWTGNVTKVEITERGRWL